MRKMGLYSPLCLQGQFLVWVHTGRSCQHEFANAQVWHHQGEAPAGTTTVTTMASSSLIAAPAWLSGTRVAPSPNVLPFLSCIKLLQAIPLAGTTASCTVTLR